jgi:hypothetical protein
MSNEEDPSFVVCFSLTNSQKEKRIVPSTTHYPIHQPLCSSIPNKRERESERERDTKGIALSSS